MTSGGPIPPDIPTSFATQNLTPPVADGTATPAANVITFGSTSSTINTADGIQVSGSGSLVNYAITNRYQQTATTVGAVTSTVTILSGLTTGTYTLDMNVAAFATAGGPAGNGYTIVGAVKSVAGVASLVGGAGAQQKDSFEDTVGANAVLGVSGNSITVTFTGVALFTFDWIVTGTYTFVS